MSTIGSIESYDQAKEDWLSYAERFEQFVIANDLKEEKMIMSVFLTSVGSKVYNLLRDLLAHRETVGLEVERTEGDSGGT